MNQDNSGISLDDISELNTNIKRIILATDGSDASILATKYAVALAKVMNASITAIYVEPSEDGNSPEGIIDRDALKEIRPTAAGLDVVRLYADKNNVEYKSVIRKGNVAMRIIEAAEEYWADVIIVGNTARSGLRRIALGSIAETVVKNSTIPILVLKS
ncbi:MAG: universal stress protein [Candidatus Aquicultor sp.]